MILVINGTNRPGNKTQIISKFVFDSISEITNEEVKYLNLEHLSNDLTINNLYNADQHSELLIDIHENLILPSTKWVIIAPEYNGSFPGVLKVFIDAISMRKFSNTFSDKKLGLIGTSSGRAGNLRGLDHMASFFNYLKMTVYYNKLPISSLSSVIQSNSEISKETQDILLGFAKNFDSWAK